MAYQHILFEIKDAISVIKFNRPKAMNALNSELLDELSHALDEISKNESIKVLVLTGTGDKAFVAGADITELAALNSLQAKQFSKKGHDTFNRLQALPIPVLAAVNGYALGGGCEVAIACDFIYASENAMFGLPEINLGLMPGFGGTQRLPRLIGKNMAKEMIFTGKMISAVEAKQLGLVNTVCPNESLMEEVLKTAKTIAQKGKVSLRTAKETIDAGMNVDLASGCALEVDGFALCMASADSKEGTRAFLEKRKADFKAGLNQ